MPESLPEALTVLEYASDAVFLTDDRFGIEWVNDAAARMFGYPRQGLIGRNIAELVVHDELARTPLRREELRAGTALVTVRQMRRADGQHLTCEVSSSRMPDGRFLGLTRDVTARAAEASRLERSEESFRALAEKLPDAIAIHRGGRFVYCNRALLTTLGYARAEDVLGMAAVDIVHPESRPAALARLAQLAKGDVELPWLEERILRRDGSSITMEIATVMIEFQRAPSYVVVGRDVTGRHLLQARVAEADRLASIGTLAAGIGHELNNPLTYVLLNLELAARRLAGLEARNAAAAPSLAALAEHLSAARDGAQRMRDIVADLRSFARADDAPAGAVDVHQAIDAALKLTGHELRLRARLIRELAATGLVELNEGRLTQVLVNLLVNACHAIPEGHAHDHVVEIRAWDEPDAVKVAVRDTGAGIGADVLPRIFEPFFSTKPASGGAGSLGLGLSICRSIVTSYGGTLTAESELGRGTTFTIALPRAAATTPTSAAPPPPPRQVRRARVLLVDDEAPILAIMEQLLAEHYDVEIARSGRAAIARLQRAPTLDVIVCDMIMPDVSGVDVVAWIEAHRPALLSKIVLMSGGNPSAPATVLATRFPTQWLDKPFTLERVLTLVAERIAS